MLQMPSFRQAVLPHHAALHMNMSLLISHAGCQMQALHPLCWSLFLALLVTTGCARKEAECSLYIQGFGPDRLGVRYMRLHCTTSDGRPMKVGINAAAVSSSNSSVKGIAVDHQPACRSSADASYTTSILYFCDGSYTLHLTEPQVHDVYWSSELDQDNKYIDYTSILCFGTGVSVNVVRGHFVENSISSELGGIFWVNGREVSISDSLFARNAGTVMYVPYANRGGVTCNVTVVNCGIHGTLGTSALQLHSSNAWISNTTFTDNIADHLVIVGFSDVIMQNVSFDSNTPVGGALYVFNNSTIAIRISKFINNTAHTDGGVMTVDDSSSAMAVGCIFRSNRCVTALNTLDPSGMAHGGVFFVSGNLTMSSCIADFNEATIGGVVYAYGDANINIMQDCLFKGNKAAMYGGAITLQGHARLKAQDSTMEANTAGQRGGAVSVWYNTTAHLLNMDMVNNVVGHVMPSLGGALYADYGALALVHNSVVVNNSACGGGGGMYAKNGAVLEVLGSTIKDNSACITSSSQGHGGGIGIDDGAELSMSGSTISHNSAYSGAGVSFGGASGAASMKIQGSNLIVSNHAHYRGGGIAALNADYNFCNIQGSIYNNTAAFDEDISVYPAVIKVASSLADDRGALVDMSVDGAVLVVLNVTDKHGVPCEGRNLRANVASMSGNVHLVLTNTSDAYGGVEFLFPVAPGKFSSDIFFVDDPTVNITYNFTLPSCKLGQVAVGESVCRLCSTGSYSLSRDGETCWPCPMGADCPGGAVIEPRPGFWHSSAMSDQVHR